MADRRQRLKDNRANLFDLTDTMLRDTSPDNPLLAENALVRTNDGTIVAKGFTLTKVGLLIDDSVTQEDWFDLGAFLFQFEDSIQWLIGDWLACGENHQWGDIPMLAERFNRDIQTLYDYAWVCRSVQFSLRKENLSYNHHKVVAGFQNVDDQYYWLNLAAQGDGERRWSVARMRAEIAKTMQPQIEASRNWTLFDAPPKINKRMQTLFMSARSGDKKARQQALGIVADFRKWLDEFETGLDD